MAATDTFFVVKSIIMPVKSDRKKAPKIIYGITASIHLPTDTHTTSVIRASDVK